MEILLGIILVLMIAGSIYILHAGDLLSAVISYGIVGFGLVICFLLLQAPDLAIIQIVVETITLVIMIAVIIDTTREELIKVLSRKMSSSRPLLSSCWPVLPLIFTWRYRDWYRFGEHMLRMSEAYVESGAEPTGSANLVTGVLLDYRAYDTLGEATILFTAAIGVITVMRLKGKNTKLKET
jgi:multicomponent Na+:H+ antiporter subunit B